MHHAEWRYTEVSAKADIDSRQGKHERDQKQKLNKYSNMQHGPRLKRRPRQTSTEAISKKIKKAKSASTGAFGTAQQSHKAASPTDTQMYQRPTACMKRNSHWLVGGCILER